MSKIYAGVKNERLKREEIVQDPRPFSVSASVKNITRKEHSTHNSWEHLRSQEIITQLKAYFVEFCQNTTIPGFKYIVESGRHHIERCIWFSAILCALVICLLLIAQTLLSWAKSPIILSMDRSMRSVWQLPFPAVTVCPISKVRATKFNFTMVAKSLRLGNPVSEEDLNKLSDVALQCENIPTGTPGDYKNSSTIDVIEKLAFDIKNMYVYMSFRNKKIGPNAMKRLLTEEGICFSFNMLPNAYMFRDSTFHASRDYLRHDDSVDVRWSPRKGYSSSAGLQTYPYRVLGAGTKESLLFVLAVPDDDLDDWCSRAIRGFKVVLHSPAEFPRPRMQAVMVPLDMEVQVGVEPLELQTEDEVREGYTSKQRQCFFSDERPLRFFTQYTQQNCEIECFANATLLNCGCVEFYMPRESGTKICGVERLQCARDVATNLQALSANAAGGNFDVTNSDFTIRECNCLPICSYLHYKDGRTSLSVFDKNAYQSINNENIANNTHYIRVIVYFKEPKYIPMLRIEQYETITLIANCGGVLGLCLGMSFLSIAEVFYWLLIRPWSNNQRKISPRLKCNEFEAYRHMPSVYIY